MPTADLLLLLEPKNILIFVLILTRISGLLATAPIFSTFSVPIRARVLLSVAVAFLLLPSVMSLDVQIPQNMLVMSVFLFKEFAIGALIGFIANLVFVSCQIGAEVLSIQSGLSFSNVMDPSTGSSTTSVSQLYIIPLSLLFFCSNAHQTLFMTLGYSFQSIKPGADVFFTPNLVHQVVYLVGQIFAIGIGIVLPLFGLLFVLEVLLGFVSKMMPKMNIFMLALPLKIYLTFILMLAFLTPTLRYLNDLLQEKGIQIMQLFIGG